MIKLLFLISLSLNSALPKDSIGIETINGQTFVIHRVEEKETLFAISRRYRTTVDDIVQYNATAKSGLEIGQILKVPYTTPVARPVSRAQEAIVHKVAPKETLYSISRTYQVSLDDLKRWNNLSDNGLAIGQELIIKKSASTRPQPVLHEQPQPIARSGVHTVQQGQTLFSIARQYNISIDQLREWNQLGGNELKLGQSLYVAHPEQANASRREEVRASQPEEVKGTANTAPVERREPQIVNTAPATTTAPVKSNPTAKNSSPAVTGQSAESIRISESLKSGDEIIEGGVAELIEGTEGNRKYLALHRTAPMGTILKVRNEMNNREVFVRVMGKLPDTAMTDKLIIKISKSAYDRLGAIDPRFRVEVTYYK
jgi:LysM repeat protein